jgi:type I restriction enzyme S subunit
MCKWREITLVDYIKTNDESISHTYPYKRILYLDTGSITSGRIQKLQEMDLSNAPSRAKRLVCENDIIYSAVRPNQRHFGFIKNPQSNLVVSTGFIVISCVSSQLFPKYLYYYLTSDRSIEYLHSIAEGSTSAYPSLKPTDIESLKMNLPPLEEQRAIADVLSALDDKIDLLHRQNQTLEALAQTLFRQWFIEEADDDWEEVELGELINITSGKGLKRKEYSELGKYPVLGANGEIGRTNLFNWNEDLIFTGRVGSLGKVFISNGKVWLSDNTLVIRPLQKYCFYIIYFFLKTIGLQRLDVGSTQPLIRQSDIIKLICKLPPIKIMHMFAKQTETIFARILHNTAEIKTIEEIRDTLLPKLMSGEMRVKEKE